MAKSTPLKSKSKSADAGNIKIDKDWEQRMLKARRMLHPSPGAAPTFHDDAGHLYKICPCCGNPFYPTPGHDRDQIYCKHPECKRLRTNLRAKIYYLKQMLQGALTRIAYCLRKKMERERRKQRMGIEPVVTPVHRRRNSMRRMKADMEKKLDDLKTCFNGMLVSLGYKTESDVNVAMNNFRVMGSELQIARQE